MTSSGPETARRHRRLPGPTIWLALAVVGGGSTVPMILYGLRARIEFDGWWHLFIAREPFGPLFWRDVFESAHPPLYFLLLKVASLLGTDPLVYRSISILAAAVAAVTLGLTTWRVSKVPATGIATALGFSLAIPTVIIANELRSYMVATALLLLALPPYLTLIRPGGSSRDRILFSVWITLALLSHYGIAFVLVAMVATPILLGLVFPTYRRAWAATSSSRWWADGVALIPSVAVLGAAYRWQMDQFRGPMNHLPDFYFSGKEPVWEFLGRNLVLEVDLFVPLELSTQGTLLQGLGVAGVLAIPLLLIWLVRRDGESILAAAFPTILLTTTAGLMAASVLGKYPFGGGLRHQFFVFPFGIATLFLLLDRWTVRLPGRIYRNGAAALVAILLLGHAYAEWRRTFIPETPVFGEQLDAFRKSLQHPEVVYLSTFNLFAFFEATQDRDWTFKGSTAGGRLQIWHVQGSGDDFLVFRDISRWNPPADDPKVYGDLRKGLREVGVSSAALFRIARRGEDRPTTAAEERVSHAQAIARAARRHGLAARRIVLQDRIQLVKLAAFEPSIDLPLPEPDISIEEAGGIRAEPNPLRVCAGEVAGTVTVSWSFPGKHVAIRLNSPDGKLWTTSSSEGSATTGPWVIDGMTFFAQDNGTAEPRHPKNTLGTVVVHHTDTGCPAS